MKSKTSIIQETPQTTLNAWCRLNDARTRSGQTPVDLRSFIQSKTPLRDKIKAGRGHLLCYVLSRGSPLDSVTPCGVF